MGTIRFGFLVSVNDALEFLDGFGLVLRVVGRVRVRVRGTVRDGVRVGVRCLDLLGVHRLPHLI